MNWEIGADPLTFPCVQQMLVGTSCLALGVFLRVQEQPGLGG